MERSTGQNEPVACFELLKLAQKPASDAHVPAVEIFQPMALVDHDEFPRLSRQELTITDHNVKRSNDNRDSAITKLFL